MDSCAASEGLGDSDPDPKVRQIPANAVGEGGVPGTGREGGEVTPQPFGNTVLQARAVVGDAPGSASYPSFLYQRRRLSSAVWQTQTLLIIACGMYLVSMASPAILERGGCHTREG